MRGIDLAIVILYLAFMIYVGWLMKGRVHTSKDFVASESKLPFSVSLATLVATLIGASLTLGQAGQAGTAGASLIGGQSGWLLMMLVFAALAPRFKRTRAVTIPEMLGQRFGKATQLLGSVLVFIYCVLLLGIQILALAKVIGYFGAPYGITPTLAAVIGTIVCIIYTSLAGMFADAYTDLIQFIIMVVAVIVVLPAFTIKAAGGFGAVTHFAAEKGISLWNPFAGAGTSLVTLAVIFALDVFVEPPCWQRMAGAQDMSTLRRAFGWSVPVIALYGYGCILTGVAGAKLIPHLKDIYGTTEAVIPAVIIQIMPPIVAGLMIVALFGAVQSTLGSYVLLAASALAYDVVRPLAPRMTERAVITLLRWSVAGLGVIALLISLGFASLWDMMIFSFTVYPAATAPALAAAWFWRRATAQGAFSSLLLGFLFTLYLCSANVKILGLDPIFPGVIATTLVLVVVSLATYRPDRATPVLGEG